MCLFLLCSFKCSCVVFVNFLVYFLMFLRWLSIHPMGEVERLGLVDLLLDFLCCHCIWRLSFCVYSVSPFALG